MFEEKEEDELKTEDNAEKTEILYGSDKIVKRAIDDFHKIKERFDNCTDSTVLLYFLIRLYGRNLLILQTGE